MIYFDVVLVFNLLGLVVFKNGYLWWKLAPNSPPLHHTGLRSGNEDRPQPLRPAANIARKAF